MFKLGLAEGLFECCSPASIGKPEFLAQEQRISARAPANLFCSASGDLQLYYQKWQSDRHDSVRSVVFVHHGEVEHVGWYNALAVRLAALGCTTFAHDAQGWGQSDGARGYFEGLEDLVDDFVEFCKAKWAEVLASPPRGCHVAQSLPGLVLIGKGIGALVVLRALLDLHEAFQGCSVTPAVVLISPAFQFAKFIGDQSNVSCGLNAQQCARQPVAQCARGPVAYAPQCGAAPVEPWVAHGGARRMSTTECLEWHTPVPDDGQHQKLQQMSHFFPKMIVTQPVNPDMLSRDPQMVDRMERDVLCWRQGYRARVLAEMVHEQLCITESLVANSEVFEQVPALILHGSGDQLFSVHGSHGFHSAWCDMAQQRSGVYPRLKIYDGAFHQLLNEPNRDEVMNDIILFVASKATPAWALR